MFFVSSSFIEEWQCELNNCIFQLFCQFNFICTPVVPREHYSVGEQQALLNNILINSDDYCGGVITIPVWPPDKINELVKFAIKLSKPVVFADQNPALSENEIPDNVSFVSVNNSDGGELAANSAMETFHDGPLKRVLVLAGYAKQGRQEKFYQVIRDRASQCDILISEDCNHNREQSERVCSRILHELIERDREVNVVFCTCHSYNSGLFRCNVANSRLEWPSCAANNWLRWHLRNAPAY